MFDEYNVEAKAAIFLVIPEKDSSEKSFHSHNNILESRINSPSHLVRHSDRWSQFHTQKYDKNEQFIYRNTKDGHYINLM